MNSSIGSEEWLERLNPLLGAWTTEATHPALPGVVVHGTSVMEWLEGERFLIQRSRCDHPDFPDSISIIGSTETDRVDDTPPPAPHAGTQSQLSMHYFDSRGVFRVYVTRVDDRAWHYGRDAPGFSQRFTGLFIDGGDTIEGHSQLSRDGIAWDDDLQITFRRQL